MMAKLTYPQSVLGRIVMTLCISAVGTALFLWADLPLPFLFGPMSACLLMALLKAPLQGIKPAETVSRTIIGAAVGASIAPATIALVPSMAASIALVPLYLFVIGLIGIPYFRKICKYDMATAWYASMPGGLMEMIQFGEEAGGNKRALSLIHATRITLFITVAPMILAWVFDASLDNPPGQPAFDIPLHELGLLALAALVGWKVATRVKLFGGVILGPVIAAAILSLSGLIHHRPPAEAIIFAQFFLGTSIGVGYMAVTLNELKKDVLAGLGFVVILAALTTLFAEIVVFAGLAKPVEGFLAFAPAGQAEMTVLAIIVGADLGFVVVHHIVRMLLVIVGAPIAGRLSGLARPKR